MKILIIFFVLMLVAAMILVPLFMGAKHFWNMSRLRRERLEAETALVRERVLNEQLRRL